jgi:TatD DNase family protein
MLSSARSREQIAMMPLDRVLTESDGPFTQHEGQPLYPWDVTRAVDALANAWNRTPAEVSAALKENLRILGTLTNKRN